MVFRLQFALARNCGRVEFSKWRFPPRSTTASSLGSKFLVFVSCPPVARNAYLWPVWYYVECCSCSIVVLWYIVVVISLHVVHEEFMRAQSASSQVTEFWFCSFSASNYSSGGGFYSGQPSCHRAEGKSDSWQTQICGMCSARTRRRILRNIKPRALTTEMAQTGSYARMCVCVFLSKIEKFELFKSGRHKRE